MTTDYERCCICRGSIHAHAISFGEDMMCERCDKLNEAEVMSYVIDDLLRIVENHQHIKGGKQGVVRIINTLMRSPAFEKSVSAVTSDY